MTLRRIADSIATRLLVLGLSIVLLGAAVRYHTLTDFLRTDLSSVVEGQQRALATYVAHDIDYKMTQRSSQLEHLATALPVELLAQPAQLRNWLKERHEHHPLFSAGLFVTNKHGIALADYPPLAGRANTNYAEHDYIQAGLSGKPYIGRPLIGRAAKEPCLPIAVPIKNAHGQVLGVLVGSTTLAAPGFLDALQQSRIGESTGGFLLISPRDKLFIAASQPEMALKPTPPAGINALHDRAMAGFRGTGITVNAQGVEEISAMVSVPSTGWFVVARLPSSEAFATVGRTQQFLLRNVAFIIACFVILLSIGLYFVFRPLFHAAAQADRMTLGEIPLEALPVARNDEVGHLISAFNRLLSKLHDNQAELARIAHHDILTGLPNRRLLADRMHQVLAQAQRRNTRVALLFMDLDGFKHINDNLGHDAGDEALRQVAMRFGKVVRQADTLARVGGDEFVLLLSDLEEDAESAAITVATKCIEILDAPLLIAGEACTLGISIGIALGDGTSSSDKLLLAADKAMYQAKETGRGRYVSRWV